MRAKFTVLQCQHEQYPDGEDYVDFEEEDAFDFQPRGFSKRKTWHRPCVNEQLNNVTSSRNETEKPRLCLTEPSHGALLSNGRISDPPSNGTSALLGTIPHPPDISMSFLPETNYEPVSYESFLEDEEELSKIISQDEGFGSLPPGEHLVSDSGRLHGTVSSEGGQQWLHQATPASEDALAGKEVTKISEVQKPVKRTMVQSGGTLEILEAEPQKTTTHATSLWDSIAYAASKAPLQENRSSFHQNDLEYNLGLQDTSSQGAEDKLLRGADKMSLNLYESKETINTEQVLSTDHNSSSTLDNPSASSDETEDNRTFHAVNHSHTRESNYSSNELDARREKRPHEVVSQGFYESFEGKNVSFSDLGTSKPVQEQILTDENNSLPAKSGTEQEASELAKGTSLLETTFAHTNDIEPSSYITTEERDELILESVFQDATATKELPEMDSLAFSESNVVANDTRHLPNALLNSPEQFLRHRAPAPSVSDPNERPRQARSLESLMHGLGLPNTDWPGSRKPLSEGNRAEQDLASQAPETAVNKKAPKVCGPHSPFCSTRFKKRSLISDEILPEVMVDQQSLEEKSNMVEGRLHLGRDAPQALLGDSADEMHPEGRTSTDGGVQSSSEGAQQSRHSFPVQGALGSEAAMAASSSETQAAAVAADVASNWDPISLGAAGQAGGLQSPALAKQQPGRGAIWGTPGSEQAQERSQMEEETNSVEQLGKFSPQPQHLKANATEDYIPESTSGQSPEGIPMKPASKEDYSLSPSSPASNHSATKKPIEYVQASPDGWRVLSREDVLRETGKREGQGLGEPKMDGESNSTAGQRNHGPGHREGLALNNGTHSSPSRPRADKPDYDEYGDTEQTMEDFDIYGEEEHDPRSFQGEVRQYFIAAVEVMWEYSNQRPQHFLKAM